MKLRASFASAVVFLSLLPLQLARAGDPQAHTSAMLKAAKVVEQKPAFVSGVGAPLKNGVPQPGRFVIDTQGSETCAYAPTDPFGVGCAYTFKLGPAINEPDNWQCSDPRAPTKMNLVNANVGPAQTRLSNLFSNVSSEVSMVCNWNHFSTNAALPPNANSDSNSAFILVRNWANELPDSIEKTGATADATCDAATFDRYLRRSVNSLHYVQDQACEHHAAGNQVCSNTDFIAAFNSDIVTVDFKKSDDCMRWLANTMQHATGANPQYWCDEAFVTGPRSNVQLNGKMVAVGALCGFAVVPSLNLVLDNPSSWDPALSLACMGIERTLRHHCLLDAPKTLTCVGPGGDHSTSTDKQGYCEGEIFSGGGQDFIGAASAASVGPFEQAMTRWATVCKEPDDPCLPAACAQWCERSVGKVVGGRPFTGFCSNASPDTSCTLHSCQCAGADSCGTLGQPCCQQGVACADPSLECGGQTGTCVPKGQQTCAAVNVAVTPASLQLTGGGTGLLSATVTSGGSPVDLSAFSLHWSNTGTAGTLQPAGGGAASNDYCGPAASVTYQALASLSASATDTVTLGLYRGAGCTGTLQGVAQATVHVAPSNCSLVFNSYSSGPTPAGSHPCVFAANSMGGYDITASFLAPELKDRAGGGLVRLSLRLQQGPPWTDGSSTVTYPVLDGQLLMPYTLGYSLLATSAPASLVASGTAPHQRAVYTISLLEPTNPGDNASITVTITP